MSGNFALPSDSSDGGEAAEYDEQEMAGPEALLFKHASWFGSPFNGAQHRGATRETCPICTGAGWIYVLSNSKDSRDKK